MMVLNKKCLHYVILTFISFSCIASHAADQFVFQDIKGKTHSLSQYQGKWVVVNYWATWCPPCLDEIPDLVALYDDRKAKDLMVFGIVFDYKTKAEVITYVDDMLMSYPIVLGGDSVVKQIGSADVLPTTYIYNPKGKLVKVKRGIVSRHYLETIMQE
jgi:thiol-disulfide isomerase/thioredoxin